MKKESTKYIALLRGINVGGRHSLPMKELTRILEEHGCTEVKTYIQSGNVVFQHAKGSTATFEQSIGKAIEKEYGFNPHIMVLSSKDFQKIAKANPYPEAVTEPKSLHVYFLFETPKNPELDALNQLKIENESFTLKSKAFYLHAPNGIGRSKLAAKVDRFLGVETTARNWNTVAKLLEMAG